MYLDDVTEVPPGFGLIALNDGPRVEGIVSVSRFDAPQNEVTNRIKTVVEGGGRATCTREIVEKDFRPTSALEESVLNLRFHNGKCQYGKKWRHPNEMAALSVWYRFYSISGIRASRARAG